MSAYNYGSYSNDNNQTSGSSGGYTDPDMTLIMTTHAAIEGVVKKVFGSANKRGQVLGVSWEDVTLVDGCLYHDPDKDNHKVFSWKEVVGISPDEADDLSADDANQYLVKNYGGKEKRYELVEAVVPGVDEPVSLGTAIMWLGGQKRPKPESARVAKVLTKLGPNATVGEEEDINNWLVNTNASENQLRSDLEGRRLAYFKVPRQSQETGRTYHYPVVVDAKTGAQIQEDNSVDTDDGDEQDADETADETDADVPDPIEDFVSTCSSLGFTDADRASTLLADLIADDGNDMTADMVDDFGGEDAVLGLVAN
jgi:hypothetical protein